jgi:hypothetical protein
MNFVCSLNNNNEIEKKHVVDFTNFSYFYLLEFDACRVLFICPIYLLVLYTACLLSSIA